jgi:large subunit ribosomal protein L18
MNTSRNQLRIHRKRRIRSKISGSAQRPRLCVFRSLTRIEAQIIDDQKGVTLAHADSKKLKAKNDAKGAEKVGKEIAKLAAVKKITTVVFDRGAYKYHGKVKALADGAREGGLKF